MSDMSNVGTDRDTPWRDREVMEYYYGTDMTYKEIGKELGCGESTVSNWFKRHGLSADLPELDEYDYEGNALESADLLRQLYVEERYSTNEIAAALDCSNNTVRSRLLDAGVDMRTQSEARLVTAGTYDSVSFYTKKRGHEIVQDGYKTVPVHRIVAVAEYGIEALEGDTHVHHINEIPWDNRPSNLEIMEAKDHLSHHYPKKMTWLDTLRAFEMYRSGASSRDIAPTFDVAPGTVIEAVRRVDASAVRNNGGS